MRVTFDSNAWEAIFTADDTNWEPIRTALQFRWIEGFICAVSFGIEAITKRNRSAYFAQPFMAVTMEGLVGRGNGQFDISMSMGPDNGKHPGLPAIQAEKLRRALTSGCKLMYGQNWMGLPVPTEIMDNGIYVRENPKSANDREGRQLLVSAAIEECEVGKAAFDAVDGWTEKPRTAAEEKDLSRACAEWADGELVVAHIAYQNKILCTNDRARSAGMSIFDTPNREWLAATYGVECLTLDELVTRILS